MFLNFRHVLDVNKTKFCCNVLFYSIVKRLLLRCGKVCLCIISLIYLLSGYSLRGMLLQVERYFSILLFSIVLCHIGLLCLFARLYFVFIIIFVNEVFERPSGADSP